MKLHHWDMSSVLLVNRSFLSLMFCLNDHVKIWNFTFLSRYQFWEKVPSTKFSDMGMLPIKHFHYDNYKRLCRQVSNSSNKLNRIDLQIKQLSIYNQERIIVISIDATQKSSNFWNIPQMGMKKHRCFELCSSQTCCILFFTLAPPGTQWHLFENWGKFLKHTRTISTSNVPIL